MYNMKNLINTIHVLFLLKFLIILHNQLYLMQKQISNTIIAGEILTTVIQIYVY